MSGWREMDGRMWGGAESEGVELVGEPHGSGNYLSCGKMFLSGKERGEILEKREEL